MMTSNQPYLLRAIHEWILDNEMTPHLLVNAEMPHVDVPAQFIKDGQIVLNIATHAVSNMLMDNEAVSFSARFSGEVKNLYIPVYAIRAIYASENGQGLVFQEIEFQEEPEAFEESTEGGLKSVDTEPESEDTSNAGSESITEKKPPFLKVIK